MYPPISLVYPCKFRWDCSIKASVSWYVGYCRRYKEYLMWYIGLLSGYEGYWIGYLLEGGTKDIQGGTWDMGYLEGGWKSCKLNPTTFTAFS